jgi:hypothetical protein
MVDGVGVGGEGKGEGEEEQNFAHADSLVFLGEISVARVGEGVK